MTDEIVTGYKATDQNMQCRGHQFKLGEWYSVEGELEQCRNGFHFCPQMAGVWCYYGAPGTRVFRCEAKGVLAAAPTPGSAHKLCARHIRITEEVTPGNTGDCNTGDCNTGNRNTGNRNTGNRNTGNRNTGDCNAGYDNTGNRNAGNRNTGDCNAGYDNTGNRNAGYDNTGNRNTGDCNAGDCNAGDRNTGYGNAGDRNTGYGNTGDRNTGDCNAGDGNTGDRNTGYGNTGNGNTGNGNTTNHSSGMFCTREPEVMCFDTPTGLHRAEFCEQYPEWLRLCHALATDEPFDFVPFERLPGFTPEKLRALHAKHIEGRKATQ